MPAPFGTSLEALRGQGEEHLGYCAAGLRRSDNAARDLLRLGALCGPGNGLLPFERAFQAQIETQPLRRVIELKRKQCLRLALVTEVAERPVRVSFSPLGEGSGPEFSCSQGFGWCPPASVYCPRAERVAVEISANPSVTLQARLWIMSP